MPIPVIQVSQMREWEAASWAAGRNEQEVISRVGHIVTQRACRMTRRGDLIVVLAGKGHNGDDARQCSRNFSDREVILIDATDPVEALREFSAQRSLQPALVVDGLFGIGVNRPLDDSWQTLIREVNDSQIPVLSIDSPSGLNSDTGTAWGAAICATVTLTLAAPKLGLVQAAAWEYVGRLEIAPDIGLIPASPKSDLYWTDSGDFRDYPPPRPVAGHKGIFGHVTIVGGSFGYHGAGVLAARGALRAQPGLVTLFPDPSVYIPVATQLQSVMVKPWTLKEFSGHTGTALLFGPGLAGPDLAPELRAEMIRLWREAPIPVLADATGLDWLVPGPVASGALRVITPHPGEAARLLGISAAEIQADRARATAELSRKFGDCRVVLKGHQTMIGRSSGPLFLNPTGNPYLAQGGSGDLLAGYLAGLLAQPTLQEDPERALRYGVWQHGAAADALMARNRSWTLEELAVGLGNNPQTP
jgi:ADP-dependent NAD(P)H-hydrate dehydratase / NAD(P)H-hydrate epimerase